MTRTPQPHPLTLRKIIGPEAEAVGRDSEALR